MDLSQNYFELFGLPVQFELDESELGQRFRQLQKALHPDKFASADAASQRVAMQYSSRVNEAYSVLKSPLPRALYLLELAGFDGAKIAEHKPGGAYLMQQLEQREALEGASTEAQLIALLADANSVFNREHQALVLAFDQRDYPRACELANQLQYSVKFISQIEQNLAGLQDSN